MSLLLLFAALSSAPSGGAELETTARALRAAAAWNVHFAQRYVPSGFEAGSVEEGELVLANPLRLRFDYAGTRARVFAVDGSIARLVDARAGTCEALRLDDAAWGRLPLAVLLDPGAAAKSFLATTNGRSLRLVPRTPTPDLAELMITVDDRDLPLTVTVRDGDGNSNEFTFTNWRKVPQPKNELFLPSLPAQPPCKPADA